MPCFANFVKSIFIRFFLYTEFQNFKVLLHIKFVFIFYNIFHPIYLVTTAEENISFLSLKFNYLANIFACIVTKIVPRKIWRLFSLPNYSYS